MTRASEERLEQLRSEAARQGVVAGDGVRAAGGPLPPPGPSTGYYGRPLLKQPTWTWEVPVYLFVGGAAGTAAMVAAAAQPRHGNRRLVRDARWIAASGGALSGLLLVSDLGRPERFLAMLRVFKPQSAMSVGAWTLSAFSAAAGMAALATLGDDTPLIRFGGNAAGVAAAATGAAMTTYTGVLLGATVIPVWADHAALLPIHFGASALGSGASLLELFGHRQRALNRLALGAALTESVMGAVLHTTSRRSARPLEHGRSGALVRAGGLLSGPVPLALRLLGAKNGRARTLAAICSVAGSLLTRFGWVEAGKASAKDAAIPLQLDSPGGGVEKGNRRRDRGTGTTPAPAAVQRRDEV